jgi:LAO/AO transport system kinase
MALQLQREIRGMLEMLDFSGWVPELVATQAREGVGIDRLWEAIRSHRAYLHESGDLAVKRRSAFAHRVRALVLGDLERRVEAQIGALLDDPAGPPPDPYHAAEVLLGRLAGSLPPVPPSPRQNQGFVHSSVKGLYHDSEPHHER